MKTIGLIGGMSYESTLLYYQIINETTKNILGGLHSAKILLYSVDFHEIEKYQAEENWEKLAEILISIAQKLEKAGADFIVICTNTMHQVEPEISKNINIPIIHIASITAKAIIEKKIQKIALLGTKYTMLQDFYKEKLIENDLQVIIPSSADIEIVNSIIYNELCLGKVRKDSKEKYLTIIDKLHKEGAEGIILGCTEICLLVSQEDTSLPIFDTTRIHAEEVAKLSLIT